MKFRCSMYSLGPVDSILISDLSVVSLSRYSTEGKLIARKASRRNIFFTFPWDEKCFGTVSWLFIIRLSCRNTEIVFATRTCQRLYLLFATFNKLKMHLDSKTKSIKTIFLVRGKFKTQTFLFVFFLFAGVSNVMNVPVSPVLAALVLTAAILFAIVCIVLATIYRKHSHK